MTTLPQTTAVRLPRPQAPTQIAVPAAVPQAQQGMTLADVYRILRGNFWLMTIVMILAVGLGLATHFALARYSPQFTATGVVEVLPPPANDPVAAQYANIDYRLMELEQRTQESILRGEGILSALLQQGDNRIRETEWYKSFSDRTQAKQSLKEDVLRIRSVPDTKLINVSASTMHPRDAQIIVQELVDLYLLRKRADASREMDNRQATLQGLKETYESRAKFVEANIKALSAQLTAEGINAEERYRKAPIEVQLEVLIRETMMTQAEAATGQQEYEITRQMLQSGQDPAMIELLVMQQPQIQVYLQLVQQAEVQLQTMRVQMGDSHPMVKAQTRALEIRRQQYEAEYQKAAANERVRLVDGLRQQAESLTRAVEQQQQSVQALMTKASERSAQIAEYRSFLDEKDALVKMIEKVSNQIDVLGQQSSTASHLSGVKWTSQPEEPEIPSFPRLELSVPLSILAGIALALGIAFTRELLDTSVKSPRDVARVGQMSVLAAVPDEANDPLSAGRLPLAIYEAPTSMIAEQFRQLRTQLQHAASLDTTRSLLVSSPNPGDGKSTVACNLAAGLALNGRRILLVDANFRRPALHSVFGVDNTQGFSDVLNNLDLFDDSVRDTQVSYLSVITSGPRPANATELLESQLLSDFIERALEEFDHVIFDSGPLLFVSESMALAPRVDGVITVVRAKQCSRGLLQRTRDALKQVKAEHLGVVLNAVRATGGGYYGRNIRTYYAYQNS